MPHSHAGLAYTNICREWRCKFSEWPATKDVEETSRIVAECQEAYKEIEAQVKGTLLEPETIATAGTVADNLASRREWRLGGEDDDVLNVL